MDGYQHIIVIGVDGAGAFFKQANTPQFDKIFKNGAITYQALSSKPTISAECWGSMLLGVGPEVHGLTNQIVGETPYPVDSLFPSLFRRIREAKPDAELGSFCHWKSINVGIVEQDLGVTIQNAPDTQLVPMICDYIEQKRPTFLFSQWDSADGVGHRHGYGTKEHLQRISEIDEMIGQVYGAICSIGIEKDTLFMVIADHGGTPMHDGRGSHGGWSDAEKYVTFAATGKNVLAGQVGQMNIRDLAAIVLYGLGLELPVFSEQGWTAQLPYGIFDEVSETEYRDISHLTGAAPRRSDAPHQSHLI